MEAGSLLHLPKILKRCIAVTLGLGFAGSVFFLVFVIIKKPEDSTLLSSAISLFQFVSTGSALSVIAFFSTKNIGTAELLAQTSRFLVDEMPAALRSSLILRPLQEDKWSITDSLGDVAKAVVNTDHVLGTPSATYAVQAFGAKIKFRITLNAFRFVVLYYIPRLNHSPEDLEKILDMVTLGAKTVGYTHRITTNVSIENQTPWVEVYFYKTTDKDLLLDSSSRLFWSQDIAVMTKSMLIQLQRGGVILSESTNQESTETTPTCK